MHVPLVLNDAISLACRPSGCRRARVLFSTLTGEGKWRPNHEHKDEVSCGLDHEGCMYPEPAARAPRDCTRIAQTDPAACTCHAASRQDSRGGWCGLEGWGGTAAPAARGETVPGATKLAFTVGVGGARGSGVEGLPELRQ
jgi:hypothetical protein